MRINSSGQVGIGKTPITALDVFPSFESLNVASTASGGTASFKYATSSNNSGAILALVNANNTAQGNETRTAVLHISYRNPAYAGSSLAVINTLGSGTGVNGEITSFAFTLDTSNAELDVVPTIRGGGNANINVRFISL